MTEPGEQVTAITGEATEQNSDAHPSTTVSTEPDKGEPEVTIVNEESRTTAFIEEKTAPVQSQSESSAALPDNPNSNEPPLSTTQFYSAEMDAIVTVYPDGTQAAVSAHPPTIDMPNVTEEQTSDERILHDLPPPSGEPPLPTTTDTLIHPSESEEGKIEGVETIDAIEKGENTATATELMTESKVPEENKTPENLDNSLEKEANQITEMVPSPASDHPTVIAIKVDAMGDLSETPPVPTDNNTDQTMEHETSEDITEPVMHVADPCTEVPEPVGTPQTSRSKISESRGGDNGPELNLAQLIDGVEVREATLEDIPAEETENVETKPEADRPKRPPPPVVSTTAQGVTEGTSTKKAHGGFHFRLGGGSKSRENSSTRDGVSPDRQTRKTLGASVRSAFGTLTRSIKKKQHEMQEKRAASKHATMDARIGHSSPPNERVHVTIRSPSDGPYDQEEQSLQSVSGVCLSQESSIQGTPSQKRRQLIKLAAHDFQRALPPEDHMTNVSPIYVNHAMQPNYQSDEKNASKIEAQAVVPVNAEHAGNTDHVLSWTATSVATSGMNSNNPVDEEQIRPIHVARGRSQQVFINRLVTGDGQTTDRSASTPVRSPGFIPGNSPKPPRPISRPVLSPLDYQTFHSEDSLDQPDMVKRRAELIHTIAPSAEITVSGEVPYQVEQEQIQPVLSDPGPRTTYKATASLDRRQYDSIERYPERDMRRAQTMRTADYANRLRERLRTFRGDSTDGLDERGGTLRASKVRSKPENYVCSETIHWPKKLFKLKRRQTVPPAKQVFSTPNEAVIPRPQPRATLSYHQPPSPMLGRSPLLQENVIVNQTIQVQGKPPRAPPVNRLQSNVATASAELSFGSPRQLTSLQTLAASPKLQRCTTLPESPQRGLIRMMDAALGSPTQVHDVTTFPYLSNELVTQFSQHDQGLRVDSETLQNTSDESLIQAGLTEVHPFQSGAHDNEQVTTESGENQTPKSEMVVEQGEAKSMVRNSVKDYLNACVRLKSVDLQGHYAAFHYPIRGFDSSLWNSRARFVDWNNLSVMQEPGYTTEYVQLPVIDQNASNFVYADKPVDTLLRSWLDCHQTVPPSEVPCNHKDTITGKSSYIYHPISFAVRLDQLLSHTKNHAHEQLTDTCFRLAVLLAYAHCRHHLVQSNLSSTSIVTDPKQILLILSTSNCLVLFKTQNVTTNETESGTDELVKYICPEQETLEQGIDNLIEQLNRLVIPMMEKSVSCSRLLKALAPPDWMAICCSRIYLTQQ